MNTPICDFVKSYSEENPLRLHMPGHKGQSILGFEHLDITEIAGADSLYEADGIIAQSETNASKLFGCPTFYSTEGSSQCIRAMLFLAVLNSKKRGKKPRIAVGRNAHKAFLTAAALLDIDPIWLCAQDQSNYLSCPLNPKLLETILLSEDITAVYVTSPDYLGRVEDISALSEVCHRHGVMLLVDNAHGAYLRFLHQSWHPMDLGADICCDSAHKTLPVVTGGAYLHVRDKQLARDARRALELFGSTSPSYLILQSLDMANSYLETYPKKLEQFLPQVQALKDTLSQHGWKLYGDELLKITLCPKHTGYTGIELADILDNQQITCEFADLDYLVLMVTPETGTAGLKTLEKMLLQIPKRQAICWQPPALTQCEQVLTPRQAVLSVCEWIPVTEAVGRILASPAVGCPPAVPIVLCGQRITKEAADAFQYYGITKCAVVMNV